MSLVKRHPIITFLVLAYALAWSLESPLVLLRDSVTTSERAYSDRLGQGSSKKAT
jgi:hypothetical protein